MIVGQPFHSTSPPPLTRHLPPLQPPPPPPRSSPPAEGSSTPATPLAALSARGSVASLPDACRPRASFDTAGMGSPLPRGSFATTASGGRRRRDDGSDPDGDECGGDDFDDALSVASAESGISWAGRASDGAAEEAAAAAAVAATSRPLLLLPEDAWRHPRVEGLPPHLRRGGAQLFDPDDNGPPSCESGVSWAARASADDDNNDDAGCCARL